MTVGSYKHANENENGNENKEAKWNKSKQNEATTVITATTGIVNVNQKVKLTVMDIHTLAAISFSFLIEVSRKADERVSVRLSVSEEERDQFDIFLLNFHVYLLFNIHYD